MKFEELFQPKPGSVAAEMQKTIDGLNKEIKELRAENAALRADKARLDFLSTLTGSGWACIHLDNKGTNDDWFLTRRQIDRRMATEPTQ